MNKPESEQSLGPQDGAGEDFSQALRKVALRLGVELDYVDGRQQVHQASDETLFAVLQALDPPLEDEKCMLEKERSLEEENLTRLVEPVLLYDAESGQPLQFSLTIPLAGPSPGSLFLRAQFTNERGRVRSFTQLHAFGPPQEVSMVDGVTYGSFRVGLPYKPALGYYDFSLHVTHGSRVSEARSFLIAAPRRCYQPASSRKRWGVGLQLYSLRSEENWGVGDLGDLQRVVRTAGKTWKADTIGIQPLHAQVPGLASPYSPSSRLFWNPLYLDLNRVAELPRSSSLTRRIRSKKFQQGLRGLRDRPLVDYDKVLELKISVLGELFQCFRREHLQKNQTNRGRAFRRFVEEGGIPLLRFCTFQALHEFLGTPVWRNWPESFQHPGAPAVQDFQQRQAKRIQYFAYVQWLCELQLDDLDKTAKKSSLSLGLYQDLPVGIHPDGADAWVFQEQLASQITVGAPPDSFNLLGQNWGLLSPNPHSMRKHAYQFFIQTLRHNMRHAGVLRIDHALGLFRMFWILPGKTGQDGIYVRTFVDEILAVLALESVRNKVLVVGEDLGTVTPAIRQKLDRAGLLSYRLLFFERQESGCFQDPSGFPEQALVAVTTHDLPTLKGYWAGRDIAVKEEAGMYPPLHDIDRDRVERAEDRGRLWEALSRHGLVTDPLHPESLSGDQLQSIYRYLARTPSRLLIVQLEDLLEEMETPNLPGAPDSAYPSWRIKLSRPLSSWLKDPDVIRFAESVRRGRRESGKTNGKERKDGKRSGRPRKNPS